MSDDVLESIEPPDRGDFRRVGKGIPLVMNPDTRKHERYRRASSSGNILDDDYNLWDWKRRTEIVGAAQRPELMALVSTVDPNTQKKQIRDIAEQCLEAGKGNARSIQGTAVHSMLDHIDLGHDWVPAPQFQAAVDAYCEALELYGLVPVDVEVKCVNDLRRIAGTADRRYRTTRALIAPDGQVIPIGSVLVGDTKTGLSLEYAAGSYATQLAAYVDSVRYDPEDGERYPFEPPSFSDWALVMHVVPEDERCDVIWVDVNAGREGLDLADRVRDWRRRTDLLVPAMPPQRNAAPEPAQVPQDASEPTPEPEPSQSPQGSPQDISDALYRDLWDWLRGRVLSVREHSELAAKHLQRLWPAGVPGLREPGHSLEQLDAIEQALNIVERDHTVPFPSADPRIKESIKHHPSWSDRWAKPKNDDPPASAEEKHAIDTGLRNHPRRLLLADWSRKALTNLDHSIEDRTALAHALFEFASIQPEDAWSDDDLTTMLDGTLNALGYGGGVHELGRVKAEDAPKIMSAAFAITSGSALLAFDEQDRPVVRFNVVTAEMQRKGKGQT